MKPNKDHIMIKCVAIVLFLFLISYVDSKPKHVHTTPLPGSEKPLRYQIASVDFHHVEKPFVIACWILLASFAKIGFHLSHKPASYIPESCMLIMLGVLTGMILFFSSSEDLDYSLSTSVFFLFLLPPIVLEAGYFMPRRPFFENIGTILLLAVVGTLWNTLMVGFSLYAVSVAGWYGYHLPLLHCLLFSSLISAVDPVAILAVFEEAQVNEVLHIVVFGESLLNDGVAVVLYNMFGTYSKIGPRNIITQDIVYGVISFFVVALGGTLIGSLFAFFTSWLTKYTEKVTVIEPLFIFLLAYVSYLMADMFKLSGILAIVFCGLIMRKYVEANIAEKSTVSVKYTMKLLSSMCESIIFLFLGLSTVVDTHVWNTAFTLCSIVFCLSYRAIGVLLIIPLLNRRRLVKMNKVDIFILIYGGLRGAISFSLAMLLDQDSLGLHTKRMFMTTTVVIVIFTSFFQGLTIRPLVEFLQVKKAAPKDKNMTEILFERCFDHLLVGIEDLIGAKGRNRVRDQFELWETKYIKPFLMKRMPTSRENKLVEVCTKLNLRDANEYIQEHGGDIHAYKKDLSMINEEQAIGEMPIIDTSHLDPVYFNREETDKWHHLVEDMMYQPRQKVKKYSRHMLFDNNPPQSGQPSPQHRYTAKQKTPRPLLEPKTHKKRLGKNDSIVSGSSTKSKFSGIGGALRRLSMTLTGSPTHLSPSSHLGDAGSGGEEEGLFFAAGPAKHPPTIKINGDIPLQKQQPQTLKPPSTNATPLLPNMANGEIIKSGGPTNTQAVPSTQGKKVTVAITPKDPKKPLYKETISQHQENEHLLKDEETNENESTPPSIAPKPPPPATPTSMKKDEIIAPPPPQGILKDTSGVSTSKPKSLAIEKDMQLVDVGEDKKTDGDENNATESEKPEDAEIPRQSLTIAEKALPWKTPALTPQKMPNPPRKLSDAYSNAPAHLPSILDPNPKPPISNQEIMKAKGKLDDASVLDSPASFLSATPSVTDMPPTSPSVKRDSIYDVPAITFKPPPVNKNDLHRTNSIKSTSSKPSTSTVPSTDTLQKDQL